MANVLLVEDDPVQAKAAIKAIEKAGYRVEWVADGINAIKAVKSSTPDIILLDVVLPGLDGYEVCRWLKTDKVLRDIPVIMLTAKSEITDKVSGFHIGADDYIPKPYNELELNARIYALLRTKSLQDELREKNRQLEDLLSKVEYMAVTDALTGLYNRRRFHDLLAKEFGRSKRYLLPLSIILIDIDHFKKINDSFGHQTGDQVLKLVADLLRSTIRDIDTAFRYGGEEFIIILPSTSSDNALNVAERIRNTIEKYTFPLIDDRHVTVSIGICGLPDKDIEDEDKLLRCADAALYKAKQTGRNCSVILRGSDLAIV